MNLLERLSPKHLLMIKAEEVNYPETIQRVIKELSNTTHWVDLKYSTIYTLLFNLKIYDYSPSTINKIFDHEKH
jgi:DNA-binding PadR family transcriptional regulator